MDEKVLEELNESAREFNKIIKALEEKQESYWNSLSKDQQLDAFCAVARRIFKGEIEDKGSYRYVLYQIFGFDTSAYMPAQMAGYLAIHNAIVDENYDTRLLEAFCAKHGIEGASTKISEWSL